MTYVAALVKYNPCTVNARGGNACPFFIYGPQQARERPQRKCDNPLGSCDSPEYDGWFKDVKEGKIKFFYPNRIRLLEVSGTVLLLYHTHRRAIVGEAKITKSTSEGDVHRYWFEEFTLYPNPVDLRIIHTDPRLMSLSRHGRWRTVYLSAETVEEIRTLSELRRKSQERLNRELGLAREKVQKQGFSKVYDTFAPRIECEKLAVLGVKDEILEKAKDVFLDFSSKGDLHGLSSKLGFYAALYVAYRCLHVPTILIETAKMGEQDPKKLASVAKIMLAKLETRMPSASPKEWIFHWSSKLDLDQETIQNAECLAEKMMAVRSLKYRNPRSIAASALSISAFERQEGARIKEIAYAFRLSEACLRNVIRIWYDFKKRKNNTIKSAHKGSGSAREKTVLQSGR